MVRQSEGLASDDYRRKVEFNIISKTLYYDGTNDLRHKVLPINCFTNLVKRFSPNAEDVLVEATLVKPQGDAAFQPHEIEIFEIVLAAGLKGKFGGEGNIGCPRALYKAKPKGTLDYLSEDMGCGGWFEEGWADAPSNATYPLACRPNEEGRRDLHDPYGRSAWPHSAPSPPPGPQVAKQPDDEPEEEDSVPQAHSSSNDDDGSPVLANELEAQEPEGRAPEGTDNEVRDSAPGVPESPRSGRGLSETEDEPSQSTTVPAPSEPEPDRPEEDATQQALLNQEHPTQPVSPGGNRLILLRFEPTQVASSSDGALQVQLSGSGPEQIGLHVFEPNFAGQPALRAGGVGHVWRGGDPACCQTAVDRARRVETFRSPDGQTPKPGFYRVYAEVLGECRQIDLDAIVEVSGPVSRPAEDTDLSSRLVAKGDFCEEANRFVPLLRFKVEPQRQ